jgi:hypothetical protein
MDVCGSGDHTERDARPVDHNMALGARLSLIRWIRAGFCSPLLAGTLAESKEALPIYLLGLSETIQEDSMQLLPYSSLMPFFQAPPTGNSASAAHLLGEHLPGDGRSSRRR